MSRHQSGFTLIELLIAVLVVSILSAVAVPGYKNAMNKSRRTDAESVLMEAASFMERGFTERNCYNWGVDKICGTADDTTPPDLGAQAGLNRAPKAGSVIYYDLSVASASASAFKLVATPATGSPQIGTGALCMNQAGQRRWNKANDTASACDPAATISSSVDAW